MHLHARTPGVQALGQGTPGRAGWGLALSHAPSTGFQVPLRGRAPTVRLADLLALHRQGRRGPVAVRALPHPDLRAADHGIRVRLHLLMGGRGKGAAPCPHGVAWDGVTHTGQGMVGMVKNHGAWGWSMGLAAESGMVGRLTRPGEWSPARRGVVRLCRAECVLRAAGPGAPGARARDGDRGKAETG